MNSVAQHPWYVVAVRLNYERSVAASLREQGRETFVPVYQVRRKWSDRNKEVELPLFPGYIFCRFDPRNRLPILQAPGVSSILGIRGAGPLPVEEAEIDGIRALVNAGLPVRPWPFLREGSFVTVERGPLTGVEGIVIEVKATCRLVVSISLLQRSVSAEIDPDWVVPRKSYRPPPAQFQPISHVFDARRA